MFHQACQASTCQHLLHQCKVEHMAGKFSLHWDCLAIRYNSFSLVLLTIMYISRQTGITPCCALNQSRSTGAFSGILTFPFLQSDIICLWPLLNLFSMTWSCDWGLIGFMGRSWFRGNMSRLLLHLWKSSKTNNVVYQNRWCFSCFRSSHLRNTTCRLKWGGEIWLDVI